MAAVLMHDTDVYRLSNAVNALRVSGYIPTGGLAYINGMYFQMLITGTSAQNYTIVAESNDQDFQARANIVSGLGAFALGPVLLVNGLYTQAFGDMAGSGGGGGGSLPDGDTVDQTIQWDGSAWQPGIVPASAAIYGEDDSLGAPLPTIDVSTASGYPLGIMVLDATGQANSGLYVVDGGVPLFSITGSSGGLAMTAGAGSLNLTPTESSLSGGGGANGVSVGASAIRFNLGASAIMDLDVDALFMQTTATVDLGKTSNTWDNLYVQNTPVVVSDARAKTAPVEITDAVLDAVGDVDLIQYKLLKAIAEKGEANARYHFGVIAQQVITAFSDRGLNAMDYGIVCHDSWDALPAETDSEGNVIVPARPAGDGYTVRYEELLVLEAARVRRELAKLSS